MDHFSTPVLQRPPHFDGDGSNGASNEDRAPRGGLRDILNPVSSAPQKAPSAQSGGPAPPRAHPPSFSLRSPTQSALHHPVAYSASPPSSNASGREPSGPRSILNNPFMSAPGPSLPPSLQAPPPLAPAATTSIAAGQAASSSNLQHPPRSPLHAPPVYYGTDLRDREPTREKSSVATSSSSFYDPTADATTKKERERRVSDTGSWRAATQASTPKVREQEMAKELWARPAPISTNSQSQIPSIPKVSFFPPPSPRHDPSIFHHQTPTPVWSAAGRCQFNAPQIFPSADQPARLFPTRNTNSFLACQVD